MITFSQTGSTGLLRIEGEMTIYNAAALKPELLGALAQSSALEVDLSRVIEIDAAGVQLLILAKKEALEAGRTLTLIQHSEPVLSAFELMGLVGWFNDPVVLTTADQRPAHGSH